MVGSIKLSGTVAFTRDERRGEMIPVGEVRGRDRVSRCWRRSGSSTRGDAAVRDAAFGLIPVDCWKPLARGVGGGAAVKDAALQTKGQILRLQPLQRLLLGATKVHRRPDLARGWVSAGGGSLCGHTGDGSDLNRWTSLVPPGPASPGLLIDWTSSIGPHRSPSAMAARAAAV